MADSSSIGDLKISILLEVYQAEQNAGKITTTLKTIETQGKKTKETIKDISNEVKDLSTNSGALSKNLRDVEVSTQKVSKTGQNAASSTKEFRNNVVSLGYGITDLSQNLKYSTSAFGDLVGVLGAAAGTGSILVGSLVALGGALAGLEKYTGFTLNPTAGIQTGVINKVIDSQVEQIVNDAYLRSIAEGKIMTYADKVIAEKTARMELIKENQPMGPGNKYGKILFEANKIPDPRTSTQSGNKTLPYIPDKVELTQQEKYIQNLQKMNEALKFARSIQQAPKDFKGLDLPKVNLSGLSENVQKVSPDEAYKIGINFKDAMTSGLDVATQLASVLNLGADNFINKFLGGLQQGFSLINSIAGFFSMISGGIGGGIFSALGFTDSGVLSQSNSGGAIDSSMVPMMAGGGNLTIVARGELTDALSFKVVDRGMSLRNIKIEKSSY